MNKFTKTACKTLVLSSVVFGMAQSGVNAAPISNSTTSPKPPVVVELHSHLNQPNWMKSVYKKRNANTNLDAQDPATVQTHLPKWLAIGDSITAHGPNAKLQWEAPTRGMAASSVDTDYVHLLQKLIQGRDPQSATDLKIVGRFGRLSAGTIEQINADLAEFKDWNADLVTIQLGENDHINEIGQDEFKHRYLALIDGLLGATKRPLILCTGVWSPGGALDPADPQRYQPGSESRIKDDIIESICHDKGLTFVPIAAVAAISDNHGAGADPGVRWHPNDAGMKGYADSIFAVLKTVNK